VRDLIEDPGLFVKRAVQLAHQGAQLLTLPAARAAALEAAPVPSDHPGTRAARGVNVDVVVRGTPQKSD
jgi:hypothetical protein